MRRVPVREGRPFPLGATWDGLGVNFALFSRHARRVRLELFADCEDGRAIRSIDLDPVRNRTGDIWHVWVQGRWLRERHGWHYVPENWGQVGPRWHFEHVHWER